MNTVTFDRLYVNVPYAEKDQLLRFRATHPVKHTIVAGANWEYLACRRGAVPTALVWLTHWLATTRTMSKDGWPSAMD